MDSHHHHHHHHHHQLQDQLVGSSAPSCYGLGITTSSNFLNANSFNSSYPNEAMLNSRHQENYTTLLSSHNTSVPPYNNLGFNYTTQNFTNHHDDQDVQHSRHKEQQLSGAADQYYRRYTELLTNNDFERNLQQNDVAAVGPTKLFGNLMNKINNPASNGRFCSQIFPSVNVSNLNETALASAGGLDMNLAAVDLLAPSRFNGGFVPSSQNQTAAFRDGFSFGFDHLQQQALQIPFYATNKVTASSNVAAVELQAKRNSNKMEPKALIQNAPKKSRLEARSSCPPFKVRKEKLGDRIAPLQQLVAPFGKTDTASVLMEAIGYIKFLLSQVETLSVPYMKASRNKPNRVMKGDFSENENEESKRDLKSRGLCLVPLTCLSYITDGGGAAVWPPPQFGGAT